jgi:hypothetical protein
MNVLILLNVILFLLLIHLNLKLKLYKDYVDQLEKIKIIFIKLLKCLFGKMNMKI